MPWVGIVEIHVLKGTVSRDFDSWFFSSNNPNWAPDQWVKAFLHMASNLRRCSTMKLPILAAAVSMTPLETKMILREPLYFWVTVIAIG
jgi:hypothetical protein